MSKRFKYDAVDVLRRAGFSYDDAVALRRISLTLHSWFEHECNGTIQRDEATGKPFWYTGPSGVSNTPKRFSPAPDREKGAMRRLEVIMAKYPAMRHYIQGDPRGASLYILRPGDILPGETIDSCYSRGLVVY